MEIFAYWLEKRPLCYNGQLSFLVVTAYLANMLDCNIVISEFELETHYYVLFWTYIIWNSPEPSTSVFQQGWIWYWITYECSYAIKQNNWSQPLFLLWFLIASQGFGIFKRLHQQNSLSTIRTFLFKIASFYNMMIENVFF